MPHRLVTKGFFLVGATVGIVVVMSIFTWVMYDMAKEIKKMSVIMVGMGNDLRFMSETQVDMSQSMAAMRVSLKRIDQTVETMSNDVTVMAGNVAGMNQQATMMNANMGRMTADMSHLTGDMNRVSYDVGRSSHAFTNPLSHMGRSMPFPNPMGF